MIAIHDMHFARYDYPSGVYTNLIENSVQKNMISLRQKLKTIKI